MLNLFKEKKGEIVNPADKTANKLQIFSPTTVKIISCKLFVKRRSGEIVNPADKTANKLQIFSPTTVKIISWKLFVKRRRGEGDC